MSLIILIWSIYTLKEWEMKSENVNEKWEMRNKRNRLNIIQDTSK